MRLSHPPTHPPTHPPIHPPTHPPTHSSPPTHPNPLLTVAHSNRLVLLYLPINPPTHPPTHPPTLNRRLLEHRGSLIIRQLSVLLHAQSIYLSLASVLDKEEEEEEGGGGLDLDFVSIMVQVGLSPTHPPTHPPLLSSSHQNPYSQ